MNWKNLPGDAAPITVYRGSRLFRRRARPAPWIGDHNGYVFGELLQMSEAEIKELQEADAIRESN